ncbi:bifunctional 4-hydroxy-2-oxoglutarate aldolase/2-dehydro-3-deoxy-phosphogluconate aldolase [Kiritimatiellaeota bacterium B1221]|nr:bifunctional 4-hydroxy-2-oxoglutarate aldolase/2-dehydro-3-deoxy-phosphogluconate aldolase [Kiritimatiellaeota bacterium B1221]
MIDFDLYPVVPVIVLDHADDALPLSEALLAGGIGIIEITFRTAAAAESISRIADKLPEMKVGAGTVVTPESAQRAFDSGSQFALAPGCDADTVSFWNEKGIPFIPGIMTPTDLQAAYKLGCKFMKFFPAEAAGGVNMLKNLTAPYLNLGIKICPTGGINLQNMGDYLALKQVFAIGGSWIATRQQIVDKDWSAITAQASEAMAQARAVR